MRIGILDTVPRKFWHIDGNITEAQKFVDLLSGRDDAFRLIPYYVAEGEWPASPAACDAYLVTGSPCSANDDVLWIQQLIQFTCRVFERRQKLIGICFGHQLLAKALGGAVAHKGWLIGLHCFDILAPKGWMFPAQARSCVYHINKEQVITLPPGSELIATSEACPYNGYIIDDRVLSFQGHPEQPRRAMINFIEDMRGDEPDEILDRAAVSLDVGLPDADLWAGWIARFLSAE